MKFIEYNIPMTELNTVSFRSYERDIHNQLELFNAVNDIKILRKHDNNSPVTLSLDPNVYSPPIEFPPLG